MSMPPVDAAQLQALPKLPRDAEGPHFAKPWQAQVFALAVNLSRAGRFSWTEWAATLGDVLSETAARGEPDDGSHYWRDWLTALERLIVAHGLSSTGELDSRAEAWREAYRVTPHGQPVVLPPVEANHED
jgi:nitrile hydratase accessory protein